MSVVAAAVVVVVGGVSNPYGHLSRLAFVVLGCAPQAYN